MTPIRIRQLSKHFGSTVAVNKIDLDIEPGELFFLLGPSGCGKTTLLRMIAGFTDPTSGSIHFGERDVTHLPANKRNAGMVFQGYALWPHMTVKQNVAFGLEVRKVSGSEKNERIEKALASVQLSQYADRRPTELSGGQQQRVALARALVIEPTVLLLDEPLSNLDAKLRLDMRAQIKSICKAAGITAIYVTHDQKEALSMADTVAVLKDGQAVQVGPPRELYQSPANRFVADFLGETNFISAQVTSREGDQVLLDSPAGPLRSTSFPEDLPSTGNVTCSIRPEAIRLSAMNGHATDASNSLTVSRNDSVYLGEVAQHFLTSTSQDGQATDTSVELKAFELNPGPLPSDGQLQAVVDPSDVVILSD